MDLHEKIGAFLSDDRLLANLVGLHAILGMILIVSIIARRILIHGGDEILRWTGINWLDGLGKEAVRRIRSLLFWSTLMLMVITIGAAVVYHLYDRDIRVDVVDWYNQLTAQQLLKLTLAGGQLIALVVGMFFAFRLVRRLLLMMERKARHVLPPDADTAEVDLSGDVQLASQSTSRQDGTVERWFNLLQRFVTVTLFLTGLWIAGKILFLSDVVNPVILFMMRMLAILMVARLLTLACRTISQTLSGLGDKHLGGGKFNRYWERVTRLFPFGERCFEAAVYISAASLAVHELHFIAFIANLGPRLVQCIGIFFVTRVLIELLTVLLNEAFGMYRDERLQDQKGQTLVPLLQSIGQYVLYFGSGIIMLGVLEVDTTPILAGAGIVGLAAGLGAQSLVTDVVSGFFILFENQYLVGDVVQIGDAHGRVEAVSIRHTQIRDEHGKLYIIPNGHVKSVINFSKGYVNAVVDIKVATSTNLEKVMADMAEAGKRLRQSRREVLGETVVKGLIDLTPNDMVIRAVTRVMPGAHVVMQNEFRRLLKGVFDEGKEDTVRLAA